MGKTKYSLKSPSKNILYRFCLSDLKEYTLMQILFIKKQTNTLSVKFISTTKASSPSI